MGYYIRVLSKQREPVSLSAIRLALEADALRATVVAEDGDDHWEEFVLAHPDNTEFAFVERNAVEPDSLGADELQEFIDEIPGHRPKSAADWLVGYLPSVQTIYSLQILSSADRDDGWLAIHATQSALWNAGGGILQADSEGFSNEDGHHILWQFSDNVEGDWQVAVLDETGSWTAFKMDLGRVDHRSEFLAGRVPPDATLL